MDKAKLWAAIATIALLAGCEARFGKDESAKDETAVASADKGSFSVDVPGFEMKLDIPKDWAENATIDSDSDIVPPGAKVSGVHINAGREGGKDGVELRFTTSDAPAKVAQWYRDDGRTDTLTIASVAERGGVVTVTGSEKDDGDPFTVRLSQAAEGGTEGVLNLRDRN